MGLPPNGFGNPAWLGSLPGDEMQDELMTKLRGLADSLSEAIDWPGQDLHETCRDFVSEIRAILDAHEPAGGGVPTEPGEYVADGLRCDVEAHPPWPTLFIRDGPHGGVLHWVRHANGDPSMWALAQTWQRIEPGGVS